MHRILMPSIALAVAVAGVVVADDCNPACKSANTPVPTT